MTILAVSSALRGGAASMSHGAVHLVDLVNDRVAQVLDWKAQGVDWAAAGGGRGLRGLAFDGERVFVAGADTLYAFTPAFELLAAYRSPFLARCHDIRAFERTLYLTSAGFDSILGFDLDENRFAWGLHVLDLGGSFQATPFDPQSPVGPPPGDGLGLCSLWCDPRGMFISGWGLHGLLHFDARHITRLVTLPSGVHNARPWRDGVLFIDTDLGVARFMTPESNRAFLVPRYARELLTGVEQAEAAGARPGFARGLCVLDDSRFVVGSAPATLTVHDLDSMKTCKNILINPDVRHSIHSIVVWPFEVPE